VPPGDTHERLMCRGCGYIHYVNPKSSPAASSSRTASTCCANAPSRRARHLDAAGRLHGSGETTEQAALREVWEESGVRAEIVSPYSIFSVPKISEVYIIFRAIALESPASTGRRPSTTSSSPRGHSLGQIYYPAIRQILERYIEERQAGVYGIYMGNDDTGKIHFIR
jgi:hypothetical protein